MGTPDGHTRHAGHSERADRAVRTMLHDAKQSQLMLTDCPLVTEARYEGTLNFDGAPRALQPAAGNTRTNSAPLLRMNIFCVSLSGGDPRMIITSPSHLCGQHC